MSKTLFFFLFLLLFTRRCAAISAGQPVITPQFSAVQGIQIKAADVLVPVTFDADETGDIFLLSEGFVCPGQVDLSMSCQAAAGTCSCDYATSSCSTLPACCQAEDPAVWASACDSTAPTNWLVLQPNQALNITAPPLRSATEPVYLRYHPASSSKCRGFGLSILAPFNELGLVISTAQTVVFYVSWTNARPEIDPNAAILRARPGQSDNMGRPRFCPNSNTESAQSNGFFGEDNSRTAFIAMYSQSTDETLTNVDALITATLFETPDVSTIDTEQHGPLLLSGVTAMGDRSTLVLPHEQSTASFSYTHTDASSCANLVVDVHSNSGSATTSITADFTPGGYVRWLQTGFSAASSIAVNICPNETLYFSTTTNPYTGSATPNATQTLVTVYVGAPTALLNINEVNPNLFGPLVSGAKSARMICDTNNVDVLSQESLRSIFTTNDSKYVSTCIGSFLGMNPPVCQIFPIANRENATLLWPASPTSVLGLTSYSLLDGFALSASIGRVLSTDLRFAVILQEVVKQSTYVGANLAYVFRTWQQLAGCTFDFGGTLLSSTGNRLFGRSPPLGQVPDFDCDPLVFSTTRLALLGIVRTLRGPASRGLPITTQRTALVKQMQVALTSDLSKCLFVPQEVYLTPFVNKVDCNITDSCCPVADQYFRFFYNVCTNVFVDVHPDVNYDVIEAVGGDVVCSTALSLETAATQVFISSGSNALSNAPCTFGQDSADRLRNQLLTYYADCRASIAGPFDTALPCATVQDCPIHPQMACLPVHTQNLYNPQSSYDHRRPKFCVAPTAVFDELIVECLINAMPIIVQENFLTTFAELGLDGTFQQNLLAFSNVEGCSATGPSFFKTHAPVTEWTLRNANAAGQTHNSCYNTGTCPYPVSCMDVYCKLTQGCTYPWGCINDWTSFTTPTDIDKCTSTYRCNFVKPNDIAPHECVGDAQQCQAECEALLSSATGFCGYCDDASGYCYVATDSNGMPLNEVQCSTALAEQTCFIQDLSSLIAEPCNGLGSCNHYGSTATSKKAVTADQCAMAPGLCLTNEGSITFPNKAGCLGVIQAAGHGCEDRAATLTDSGCLYDTSVFPNKESCTGAADPIVPSIPVRGWIDVVDTEEECTGNEMLFVCQLPYKRKSQLTALSNFNNRTACASRVGTWTSPYRWEQPTFIAGSTVALRWMNVQAIAAGTWTQRFNFPKFSSEIIGIIDFLQTGADLLSARCSYSSVQTVGALGAACQLDGKNESKIGACSSIFSVGHYEAPSQQLGTETVCDTAQIADYITYPFQYDAPPVLLTFTNHTNLRSANYTIMTDCVDLTGLQKSNSKFNQPRRRIRETSFFIVRQDTDIAALSTLSETAIPNGFILTDAVTVQADNTSVDEVVLCIQARSDFLDQLQSMKPNCTDWSDYYLTMGVLNNWTVTPFPSRSSSIQATYLAPNGTRFNNLVGNRIPPGLNITSIFNVCRRFSSFDLDPSNAEYYVAVITYNHNPNDVSNGFSSLQTVWLYITASIYLVPVLFLWLPLVIRSATINQSLFSVPMIATFLLSLFLVFRSALLFGLASGEVTPSSTTEFALTDIAVWCEFAAICLLGLVITVAVKAAKKLRTNKGFAGSHLQQLLFVLFAFLLLSVFIAFVIAYSQSGDSSSGITNPQTTCQGRVPAGVGVWTTRRILRLSYECLLAAMGLAVGLWLIWICYSISNQAQPSNSRAHLFRLAGSTAMLAIMILSHAIIALILIGTEWSNFIFGITMLYVTELAPLFMFFVLTLWKNITEFSSLSFSWPVMLTGSSRNNTPSGTRSTPVATTTGGSPTREQVAD